MYVSECTPVRRQANVARTMVDRHTICSSVVVRVRLSPPLTDIGVLRPSQVFSVGLQHDEECQFMVQDVWVSTRTSKVLLPGSSCNAVG